MFQFLAQLFDTSDFPVRWECGNWTSGLGWLHILSDLAVWSAYVAIPCVLVYFVWRRRNVPFRTVFLLFGAFILACGTTHLMEALIFWWPAYRLAGVIKLFTAIVSWGTVVALVPVTPKALAMRSPEDLEREIAARKETENALQKANAQLQIQIEALEASEERLRYTKVVEHQREQLQVTLTSIGDGVITTDSDGHVTLLNPVAEELTGWANSEAAGQPLTTVFRIVNEKTRNTVENPVARVLATGRIVGLANHTILIAKDGRERAIDDSAAPIRNSQGDLGGVVLVFRDVTEQRKSERSARLLASIVASSEDAIIGKDINGTITNWNSAAERIFGYTAAEAIGRPIGMLTPPDSPDEMPGILARLKQGERIDHFDTLRRAKDGTLVPISLTVSPIRDEDGEIVGASKIARDISERKRAEEALREEKARLHATLTGIGDAVIATDGQGRITIMNPVAETLTGWKEEALGRPLEDVFHIVNEQTRAPVETPVRRVMRDGTIVGLANHTALVARDGTIRPIEDSAAPIRGEQGQIRGVVMVFRDATERRAAEAAAERHQEILRLVHRIGKIGHWEWNSVTDENKWSPEIEALYGLEPGTFQGTYDAWAKLLHPDDLAKQEEVVRRALETGQYFTEFRVIWPDGSVHWLEARAKVFKDDHEKPVRIMGVNMDVTERKRAEQALRDSEQRATAFLNNSATIAWLKDEDGRNVFLSDNYVRRFGLGDWRNKTDSELWPHEIAEAFRKNDLLVLGRDSPLECVEEARTPGGTVSYWLNSKFWFQDASGCKYVGGVGVDITERKRLEREREERAVELAVALGKRTEEVRRAEKAEQLLREDDRRKNEFLATLAHELRNPLAPLRSAVEIAHKKCPEIAELRWAIEVMGRQVGHMSRMLDDLLDVSRITRNRLELRRSRITLAAVLEAALEISRPPAGSRGHRIDVTLPPQPLMLDGDSTRLAQVFANLLNNAAKYTDKPDSIRVTAEQMGDEVVVRVRDNGIGIAPEMLAQVFEIFSQSNRALERSQGGLGIGLSLVKGIVGMHGGTVEARSDGLGKGAEFVVRLPLAGSSALQDEAPGEVKGPAAAGCRILLADDNVDGAETLAMILREMGNDVRIANDGQEAIALAEAFRPDVVLLDIGMPKVNGYEAARRIRERPWGKNMVLIAVTGWGNEDDKRRSDDAGFDAHMIKPVSCEELNKVIAGLQAVRIPALEGLAGNGEPVQP